MRVEYETLGDSLRRISKRNQDIAVRRVTKVILNPQEKIELLRNTQLTRGVYSKKEDLDGYVGRVYDLDIYVEEDDD